MPGMKRLLLAVNDSDASARAVPVVRELARSNSSEVLVLHVRDKEICCKGQAWEKPMTCTPDELVSDLVAELRAAGVDASGEVHSSLNHREADEILATAEHFDADVIVAGYRRPRLSLPLFFEKPTGQKIAERARRPLLLVP
jgi:nucleotide-binding universal stress UspA family protein